MRLSSRSIAAWLHPPTLRANAAPGVMTTASVLAGAAIGYAIGPAFDARFDQKLWAALALLMAVRAATLLRRFHDGTWAVTGAGGPPARSRSR